jgi:molybdopterin molybdotransferase
MKKGRPFMISVVNALEIILDNTGLIENSEMVDIFNVTGRTLFKNIISGINVPQKDNSAMDGYAVICSETSCASSDKPAVLSVISEVQAGGEYSGIPVKPGEAVRIMTGAPIPDGADAIIPFENTEEINGKVKIYKGLKKYENIRFAGEDIRKGDIVLKKGTRINSARAGLIASMNISSIEVFQKPEVAVISTGDEIVELGSRNLSGKIVNSNAYTLYCEIKKYGGKPVYLGIVKDDIVETADKLKEAMKSDIIITSGGVSMGKYDFIPEVMKNLGVDIKIQKVLMKPGKPVVFGHIGKKLFFGLPGNPVSVMVSFMEFVRPALLKMSGAEKLEKPVMAAKLIEEIKKKPGRKYFIRGKYSRVKNEILVKLTGAQGSGILSSMSEANCLIILPEETGNIKPGEIVDIQLIDHEEI